ncbi:unnamed protein product [Orchesella dallaii]
MSQDENGSLTGIGYQIVKGCADIGLDLSRPFAYRLKYLTFFHGVKGDRAALVFRQPKVAMFRNILFRPFRLRLWMFVIGTWLAICISSVIILRRWKRQALSDDEDEDSASVLLPVTATVLARSMNFEPLQLNVRQPLQLILFVSSAFGLLIISVYCAFIVSTLKRPEPPIKSFGDLIKYDFELLASNSLPDIHLVYSIPSRVQKNNLEEYYSRKANENFVSKDNSIARLFKDDEKNAEDNVAWLVMNSDFYYDTFQRGYSPKEVCQISLLLHETQEFAYARHLTMFMAKGNQNLTEIFNRSYIIHFKGKGKLKPALAKQKQQENEDPNKLRPSSSKESKKNVPILKSGSGEKPQTGYRWRSNRKSIQSLASDPSNNSSKQRRRLSNTSSLHAGGTYQHLKNNEKRFFYEDFVRGYDPFYHIDVGTDCETYFVGQRARFQVMKTEHFAYIVDLDAYEYHKVVFHSFLNEILQSAFFRHSILFLVMVNAVLIGLATLPFLQPWQAAFDIVDMVILSVFIFEIIIKWIYDFRLFWTVNWNRLDFLIVFLTMLASLIPISGSGETTTIAVSVVRAFRSLRCVR